ncbi:hypothetical protein GCM10028799_46630 [Kribbella italica]
MDVLGPDVAKRVEPLGNGQRYVRAGQWPMAAAWLVDVLVCAVCVFIGIVVLVSVSTIDDAMVGLGVIVLIPAVPLLYGVFYGNGRSLGALLTGTRLIRLKDGGRLGFSAPWAMLVRVVLLPFLIVIMLIGALGGGTGSPPGSLRRRSQDIDATHRLQTAEASA